MLNGHRLMIIKELNKANAAILGITQVMDAILVAEGNGESNCELRDNGFIKGCLLAGLDILGWYSAERLEKLEKLTEAAT